jgi:hypothetical protein
MRRRMTGRADAAGVGDEDAVAAALRCLGDIRAAGLSLSASGPAEDGARTLDPLTSLAASGRG